MTLHSLNKLRQRDGVTLVELLVVILIVTILAVTMLPMFKKYVVQAQYAAEPIPLVGHIRTQIGLYQYEHNELPWFKGIDATKPQTITFEGKDSKFNPISYENGAAPVYGSGTAFNAKTPYGAMDISVNELSGKRITPDQVHFTCLLNEASYGYAVGIFGKGGDGLPANTGYAVAEYFLADVVVSGDATNGSIDAGTNEQKGFKFVATWKNYTGDGSGSGKQFYFGNTDTEGVCYVPPMSGNLPTCSVGELFANQGFLVAFGSTKCGNWEYVKPVATAQVNPPQQGN